MSTREGDDDFVTKTHAELATINAELRVARRNRPTHAWCPDNGGCKPCQLIRDLHRRANDHLYQLEGRDPEPWTDPQILAVYFHTPGDTGHPDADTCGLCQRHRSPNQHGIRMCIECDIQTGTTEHLEQPTVE